MSDLERGIEIQIDGWQAVILLRGLKMTDIPSGTPTFKDFEHSAWQTVADPYHHYFSGLTGQTIDILLEAVQAKPGMRLLDIASGPGIVAAAAANRGASVTAVDFSAVMVEKASKIYPQITFMEADAENLPFDNDSFDAAVMNFGLLHLSHPERALREAFRVIRSGGRFAFTVWAPPSEALAFGIALKAIESAGNASAPLPAGPPFFRFSAADESKKEMVAAGFEPPAVAKIPMIWQLESPNDLFKAFFLGTPRTGGLLRAQTQADLKAIENAIIEEGKRYLRRNRVEIPMASLVVSANKK
jgi:SAM-dependent methyltransferase